MGRKGIGPDEFQLFPIIYQNIHSDKLYIWGYTPLSIHGYTIHNDLLTLSESYTLEKYETFNQLHIVIRSKLIFMIYHLGKIFIYFSKLLFYLCCKS
jgi:hypothetical protein